VRPHVEARARPRLDQAPRLQQPVGLEHGGRTDAAPLAGLAHRRQALARLQQAIAHGLRHLVGQLLVSGGTAVGHLIWLK
jgi:hypothetical protein